MALRNIVLKDDPILRKTCRSVLNFDEKLSDLIDDMIDTMYEADGCGLAAPQVGILRRVCVVDVGEGPIEMVNPVIVDESGVQEEAEGCLSLPGEYGVTRRPMRVTVKAQNRKGESFTVSGEGLAARAFCHEIDHLNGILYIDKVIRKID